MKVKTIRIKNTQYRNINPIKAETAILISDKADFSTKKITKDIDGHYRMKKGKCIKKK